MRTISNDSKVALVTGSTRGIGFAIAERLANDGFYVVTNGRSKPAKIIGARHIVADVSKSSEVNDLVAELKSQFRNIDVLVCNVGSGRQIDEINSPQRWEHYLSLNLFSSVLLVEALMGESLLRNAKIIGISSIAGSIATPAPIEYSASKAALNSFFKNMAFQHAGAGINFNMIALGNVLFPGSTWEDKINSNKNMFNKYLVEKIPAKRFASLAEVADVASFLASTKCDFMTGATITVDGGQSL